MVLLRAGDLCGRVFAIESAGGRNEQGLKRAVKLSPLGTDDEMHRALSLAAEDTGIAVSMLGRTVVIGAAD